MKKFFGIYFFMDNMVCVYLYTHKCNENCSNIVLLEDISTKDLFFKYYNEYASSLKRIVPQREIN